jgi:two-component system, NtrC family, nitrogen regulation sensor histidine kinase GlnL
MENNMPIKDAEKSCFVFALDKKLRITSWCKELNKIYGHSIHTIKGIHLNKIMPMLQKDTTDKIMQVFEHGRPLILKNQKTICFCGRKKSDIHISPLKDKTGKVKGANVTTMAHPDATTLTRLKRSQRLLNIGKVAATLAHGVRSPLNAIKGCVIYIRENYDNEKKLIEFSKIMEEEIARLDHFISNFLSTSISDKGSAEVNVNKLLKKIKILISLQAQSQNISTQFEYGHIPPVTINSFHLEHAILNVINNAIEAMPLGGLLTIKTLMKNLSGNDFVTIEISDTGCGMKRKKYTNGPVLDVNKGKGLGLFITREILRSNGGCLEIKSTNASGTTVKLCLPKMNL